jgi:N-acetyltransferase
MPQAPYTVTNSFKGYVLEISRPFGCLCATVWVDDILTVLGFHCSGLLMRTYARNVRRTWDSGDDDGRDGRGVGRVAKRRRVEKIGDNIGVTDENDDDSLRGAIRATSVAVSSSPSNKNSTIFSLESHDDQDTATPPSSPPPPTQSHPCISPPAAKTRKPTFSFLKCKRNATREESEPLGEVINSSSRSSLPAQKQTPSVSQPRQQTLHQMQLDLGAPLRKACAECCMEFVPANEEDSRLHRMFHNMNREGVELGKTFMKSAMKWVYEVGHIQGSVVVVDRKLSPSARMVVQKVLNTVNRELSAVDIDDVVLWSQRCLDDKATAPDAEVRQSDAEKRNDHKSDRYKVFLHVTDGKCVGLCLAERITKAHRVRPETTHRKIEGRADGQDTERGEFEEVVGGGGQERSSWSSSSISMEGATVPAVVGVSRIWVSKTSRRKGIANNLLECVLNQFIYGMEIDKDELAFSQPTESGGHLARAWYGEESGWLVYDET